MFTPAGLSVEFCGMHHGMCLFRAPHGASSHKVRENRLQGREQVSTLRVHPGHLVFRLLPASVHAVPVQVVIIRADEDRNGSATLSRIHLSALNLVSSWWARPSSTNGIASMSIWASIASTSGASLALSFFAPLNHFVLASRKLE